MSNDDKPANHVEALITKAAQAKDAAQAQGFAQAACNAANAMCALKIAQKQD